MLAAQFGAGIDAETVSINRGRTIQADEYVSDWRPSWADIYSRTLPVSMGRRGWATETLTDRKA